MIGMTGTPVTEQAGGIDAPDFVVVDVETSCSQVGSICQIGIVGFNEGRETFAYETLLDTCDRFSSLSTCTTASLPIISWGCRHLPTLT
ncbi:hypothetical protein MOP88_16720 [Sphingomonas sp. WKB10]|jgi:DNA polymerase-3 subunit epsilon|nr:hypothetical protein [Sphingomonas sp. WKB10]